MEADRRRDCSIEVWMLSLRSRLSALMFKVSSPVSSSWLRKCASSSIRTRSISHTESRCFRKPRSLSYRPRYFFRDCSNFALARPIPWFMNVDLTEASIIEPEFSLSFNFSDRTIFSLTKPWIQMWAFFRLRSAILELFSKSSIFFTQSIIFLFSFSRSDLALVNFEPSSAILAFLDSSCWSDTAKRDSRFSIRCRQYSKAKIKIKNN